MTLKATAITTALQQTMLIEAQFKAARGVLQAAVDQGPETMKRVDYATDGLFTPQGAQKANRRKSEGHSGCRWLPVNA